MLSILRRQSQNLEKELLETRQALAALKRTQAEHDAVLAARDERIRDLELLLELRGAKEDEDAVVAEATPEPAAVVTKVTSSAVLEQLEALKKKLLRTESNLTTTELQKEMAELQLLTQTSKIRRELTRDLDGTRAAAKQASDKVRLARRSNAARGSLAPRFTHSAVPSRAGVSTGGDGAPRGACG
jgi:hypothetical protein